MSDDMERNTDRWWYDKGYSLGVAKTQRDATLPRLTGLWAIFVLGIVEPVMGATFLVFYTAWEALEWRDRCREVDYKREIHDPGKRFE